MKPSISFSGRTRKLTIGAMFIALECIVGFTPIGLIPLGAVSITILHIPVIIAALVEGMGTGLVVALSFGLLSMYKAFSAPGIVDQLFRNPLISVLPRLMIPLAVVFVLWLCGRIFKKYSGRPGFIKASYALAAAAGSLSNTLFTVGALSAAIAINPASIALTEEASRGFLLGLWASVAVNTALECAASVIIVTAIAIALDQVKRQIIRKRT